MGITCFNKTNIVFLLRKITGAIFGASKKPPLAPPKEGDMRRLRRRLVRKREGICEDYEEDCCEKERRYVKIKKKISAKKRGGYAKIEKKISSKKRT